MSVKPQPAATATPGTSSAPATPEPKRSFWGGVFGWIVVPGTLATALVALGVHVGANHPGMWFSRLVIWLTR